jgi:hypothetical protein
MRRSRSLDPATRSATGSSPTRGRCGRTHDAARLDRAYDPPTLDVQLARHQWEDGRRRIEQARSDPEAYARLTEQVELVAAELRRRVGLTYTLAELAQVYDRADDWARDVLDDARDEDAPPPDTATVADAAFHLYARGASDYTP